MKNRYWIFAASFLLAALLLPQPASAAEPCKCDKGTWCGVDNNGNPWSCSGTGQEDICDIPVGAGSGYCVQCLSNNDCDFDSEKEFCGGNKRCHHCVSNNDCGILGEGNVCVNKTTCVECDQSTGCAPWEECKNPGTANSECVECLNDDDCNSSEPICTNNSCGPCTSHTQCANKYPNEAEICSSGQCVECTSNFHCEDEQTCHLNSCLDDPPICI